MFSYNLKAEIKNGNKTAWQDGRETGGINSEETGINPEEVSVFVTITKRQPDK